MSFDHLWPEIKSAKTENKHELVLGGPAISKRIESSGFDNELFSVTHLNFLNINDTCLEHVSPNVGNLVNLTTLVLHSNKISSLPTTIGNLSKLKVLDLSRNKLESVPDELKNLLQLTTLNLASNSLQEIPCLSMNTKLSVLDLSRNKFEKFPDICHADLVHLSEVNLNGNKIKEMPGSISDLPSLKNLDVGDNEITAVPGELADLSKLKEINLKGNKLNDRRLFKLVDQCRSKQVLDYVRQHCPRSNPSTDSGGGGGKGKKGKKGKKGDQGDVNAIADSVEQLSHRMQVIHVSDSTPIVRIDEVVKSVRPHILCCIVRNIAFTEDSLKKFIQLQTKLHDTVCEKRHAATIATHDLDLIAPGPVTYKALPPKEISIRPLMRARDYTGQELFNQLQKEADDLRKEKKRHVYSGIHKYLYLLEGKPVYPILVDSSGRTISFPPITNSDVTKLSINTKSMFIEVTSASGQGVCRNVLDTLMSEMLTLGIGDIQNKEQEEDAKQFHTLSIEQVKIVDMEGNLKAVYPGRNDLVYENHSIAIIRE
ncbi:leucine-rich repeat-containing protein 47 [Anabrus simplex]|uniref:leucine-rich repeat-containing protein 47 n=1 Tax=Anabrus simplex TaxID=316456 RepID=UPI0035A2856D